MNNATDTDTDTDDRDYTERNRIKERAIPHTQDRAYRCLALTIMEKSLDEIEQDGAGDALEWIETATTGRLSLREACSTAGVSPRAIQEEARRRLRTHQEADDPVTHDEVGSYETLEDHSYKWISKRDASERFETPMTTIQKHLLNSTLQSVLAPRSADSGVKRRFIPERELVALYG